MKNTASVKARATS
jgi:hypothetical protein